MSELNDLILIFSQDEGTIDLNKGIIEALGRPKQVQIRLDEKTKQMMLDGVRNTPSLKGYKDAGYNFRYVFRSHKDKKKVLLDYVFTKKDY